MPGKIKNRVHSRQRSLLVVKAVSAVQLHRGCCLVQAVVSGACLRPTTMVPFVYDPRDHIADYIDLNTLAWGVRLKGEMQLGQRFWVVGG